MVFGNSSPKQITVYPDIIGSFCHSMRSQYHLRVLLQSGPEGISNMELRAQNIFQFLSLFLIVFVAEFLSVLIYYGVLRHICCNNENAAHFFLKFYGVLMLHS